LLAQPLFVESAELRVPDNCQSPIAASIKMSDASRLDVQAEFDFDHGHDELWSIEIRCAEGVLRLDNGGALRASMACAKWCRKRASTRRCIDTSGN
jgi:D-galactose 1-dehydrogenase